MPENAQNPQVTIEMESGGKIVLELYYDKAPNTVLSFLSLVKEGYYDGVIFHRVVKGFMIQGGDPDGTGTGGPGYSIKGEFPNAGFTQNDLQHTAGTISMARQGHPNPDLDKARHNTAGSQFFICDADCPSLDGGYAAFGRVTEGMDVVLEIAAVPTDSNDRPLDPVVIKSVTADTHGVEFPAPEVIK
ncbi:MAG: peptidylprolyl isomerase [Oscillospiraceae bacterium]|nr:peptidylprolyl isomerase [Oscillospiraceae bacterium]